jgi:hypothetical protein
MSPHRSLRLRREYKPRFDTLEDRAVPAASVVVTGSVLTITGDATSQSILVIDNGGNGGTSATPPAGSFNQPSFTKAPTKITVIADGVSQTFTQDIRTVIINTGTSKSRSKSDTVVYDFTNGLQGGGQRTVTTTLGGRRGNFNMILGASPAPIPGGTGMFLQGGIGSDASLTVTTTGTNRSRNADGTFAARYIERLDAVDDFSIGDRSSFLANLTGGPGNDNIGVEVLASSIAPNSSLTVMANGLTGTDRIAEDLTVSGAGFLSTGANSGIVGGGTVTATELGGRGDDVFGLLTNFSNAETNFEASQPQPPGFTETFQPLKVNAKATGGRGRNIGLFTPNVLFSGIRDVTIV